MVGNPDPAIPSDEDWSNLLASLQTGDAITLVPYAQSLETALIALVQALNQIEIAKTDLNRTTPYDFSPDAPVPPDRQEGLPPDRLTHP